MRRLLFVVAILLLSAAPDVRTPYQIAVASTAMIETPDGTGMGVFISEHLLISAAHVTGETMTVRLADGASMKASLIRLDRSRDLALLRVEGKGIPMPLGEEPCPGDELTVVGGEFGFNFGHCRKVLFKEWPTEHGGFAATAIDHDTPCNFGDSGGPVIKDGKLVGIVVTMNSLMNSVNYAVSITEVRSFLDE